MKVIVIYGGKSAEHDISILTASSIIAHLDYSEHIVQPVYITREGKWLAGETITQPLPENTNLYLKSGETAGFALKEGDSAAPSKGVLVTPSEALTAGSVVFPALHGPNGEDGTIQGLFETLNVAYVGAGVLASSVGMDKIISKQLFQHAQIPQVPFVPLISFEWQNQMQAVLSRVEGQLVYPMFIKPANMGSSVGISRATHREELINAIQLALQYDRRVIVEQGVSAREIEVAVMGNDDVQVSVPGEIVKEQEFYDYDEKYIHNNIEMAIPADVPAEVTAKLQEYAELAYRTLDCTGLTRVDFFVTHNNDIYINEVNTMPGFTQFSMYPSLWQKTGKPYEVLLQQLLDLAVERFNARQAIRQTLEL